MMLLLILLLLMLLLLLHLLLLLLCLLRLLLLFQLLLVLRLLAPSAALLLSLLFAFLRDTLCIITLHLHSGAPTVLLPYLAVTLCGDEMMPAISPELRCAGSVASLSLFKNDTPPSLCPTELLRNLKDIRVRGPRRKTKAEARRDPCLRIDNSKIIFVLYP